MISRLNQSKLQMGATGFIAPNGSTIAVFAGGKHEDGAKNRTDVVDFILWNPGEAPKWSTARLSAPRSMISVVASSDGSLVFFAGGEYAENRANSSTKECSDVVEVWDVRQSAWRHPPLRLSQPRKKLASVAVGSRVLFAGGYLSGVGNVATVDILDLSAGLAWSKTNLSTSRFR